MCAGGTVILWGRKGARGRSDHGGVQTLTGSVWLYKVSSPCGRDYVGITTKEPSERLRWHAYNARRLQSPLALAIKQYGVESMQLVILAKIERRNAADTEQRAIAVYGTIWPFGLNATPG